MDIAGAAPRSGAVVALKRVELAKTRLGNLADPLRRRIAQTMAVDTLAALSASVDLVVVVSDEPALDSRLRRSGLSVTVLSEPGAIFINGEVGMNGALSHGAAALSERGCRLVLACVGDLPALRPGSVTAVLAAARARTRSFVADASGVGTTMLVAYETELDPRFQGPSAAAHAASGAVALTDELLGRPLPDARRDVDTQPDLVQAGRLGLGRDTAALIDPATGAPGRYDSVTVTDRHDPGGRLLMITSTGHRLPLSATALPDDLRHVRAGQRLHAVTSAEAVIAVWL